MKITLYVIGKTDDPQLNSLIYSYQKRLSHYISFRLEVIPDIKNAKNLSHKQLKEKEGELILKKLNPSDVLVLLDERGKEFRSIDFAKFIQAKMNNSIKHLIFVVGGAYGFSDKVYQKSQGQISLSKMTFSHQMVRLFFVEQLYRAYSIINNQPYHHE